MKNKIKEYNIWTTLLFVMTILSSMGLIFANPSNKIIYGFVLFLLGIFWGIKQE